MLHHPVLVEAQNMVPSGGCGNFLCAGSAMYLCVFDKYDASLAWDNTHLLSSIRTVSIL